MIDLKKASVSRKNSYEASDDIKVEAPQLWIRSAMRMKSRP